MSIYMVPLYLECLYARYYKLNYLSCLLLVVLLYRVCHFLVLLVHFSSVYSSLKQVEPLNLITEQTNCQNKLLKVAIAS